MPPGVMSAPIAEKGQKVKLVHCNTGAREGYPACYEPDSTGTKARMRVSSQFAPERD